MERMDAAEIEFRMTRTAIRLNRWNGCARVLEQDRIEHDVVRSAEDDNLFGLPALRERATVHAFTAVVYQNASSSRSRTSWRRYAAILRISSSGTGSVYGICR